jgi:phosphate transport system substrate-binding protein
MVAMLVLAACGNTDSDTPNTSNATPAGTADTSGKGTFTCVQGNIKASGSSALEPLVTKVKDRYVGKCQGATITVATGGSKKGLTDVDSGAVDIGNSDVLAGEDQTALVDHQVAVVIFSLIVNPDAGVTNLTTKQIQDIYTGKVSNWKDVGGVDKAITVVSRPASSGTRATFKQFVLQANESPANAQNLTVESTGTVIDTVASTAGSIGYVTVGGAQANASKVKVVSIDGAEPTVANVTAKTYKFWNIEHMYTKGQATGLAKAFLDYFFSDEVKPDFDAAQFVKITDIPQDVRDGHK